MTTKDKKFNYETVSYIENRKEAFTTRDGSQLLKDEKGRIVGTHYTIQEIEVYPATDGMSYHGLQAGHKYIAWVQANRDWSTFGAMQPQRFYKTLEDAKAYVKGKIKGQMSRAWIAAEKREAEYLKTIAERNRPVEMSLCYCTNETSRTMGQHFEAAGKEQGVDKGLGILIEELKSLGNYKVVRTSGKNHIWLYDLLDQHDNKKGWATIRLEAIKAVEE